MFSNTSDELNVIQREREYPVMRAFGNALIDDEEADGRVRTRSYAFRELAMTEYEDEGYDLFRRAIVRRDADAWAAIHARYRRLLVAWAYRHGARAGLTESAEDLADQAFARAWAALTPERFAAFPSLAPLLSYLRACVATTVIDSARAQASGERLAQQLPTRAPATPEQIVLADLGQDALWRTVLALAATPAERVVLVESFVDGLPPRMIRARHPQLFPDIATLYHIKRNLFARLQRNRDLLQVREEVLSI